MKKIIKELAKLGVVVANNQIRKQDLEKVEAYLLPLFIEASSDILQKALKEAKGTDYEDFDKNAELKQLLEDEDYLLKVLLESGTLKTFFSGDYHMGYEHHSFPREYIQEIKSLARDAGQILGHDIEEDKCPECGLDLEGYDSCSDCDAKEEE